MRYKLDEDHAAARQEVLDCFILLHFVFLWLDCATGDATAFAVGFTNDLSFPASLPAGRAGGAAGELHIHLARVNVKIMQFDT
jgi:hypothetical protein